MVPPTPFFNFFEKRTFEIEFASILMNTSTGISLDLEIFTLVLLNVSRWKIVFVLRVEQTIVNKCVPSSG